MNYSVSYLDKYIKIIDKRNNEVIASGKVLYTKNAVENNGISFDNKWFFRETNNLKFEVVDFIETKLCEDPTRHNLYCQHLNDTDLDKEGIDVLRDFGYDELDPEISKYIYKLNDITPTIKTTTSCCGHGKAPWQIEFEFSTFREMSIFINVVESFNGKLILHSISSAGTVIRNKYIHLELQPKNIDNSFTLLKKFCKKVKAYMNLV